jgi:hypothetical protein
MIQVVPDQEFLQLHVPEHDVDIAIAAVHDTVAVIDLFRSKNLRMVAFADAEFGEERVSPELVWDWRSSTIAIEGFLFLPPNCLYAFSMACSSGLAPPNFLR